jgi:hypothetical protein
VSSGHRLRYIVLRCVQLRARRTLSRLPNRRRRPHSVPVDASGTVPLPANHLFWQLWVQVWYWLSQEERQGLPNVVGHTRLHDVLVLEQLARHASEDEVARRCLMLPAVPVSAATVPTIVIRSNPPKIHFTTTSTLDRTRLH